MKQFTLLEKGPSVLNVKGMDEKLEYSRSTDKSVTSAMPMYRNCLWR
jgi:hypothetical protein